jgi:cell division septation protein DedD
MAFFVFCLLALGLSFFFGLMTGLSEKTPAAAAAGSEALAPGSPTPPAVPEAGVGADRLAANAAEKGEDAGPVPTPPATLQTFEDRIPAEPTPSPAPPPPKPLSAEGVWIQVASLTSRPEADALAAKLSARGYHAQVATAPGPKGRVFRVRVGPYRSEEEAGKTAQRLRQKDGISQTWIVREGT